MLEIIDVQAGGLVLTKTWTQDCLSGGSAVCLDCPSAKHGNHTEGGKGPFERAQWVVFKGPCPFFCSRVVSSCTWVNAKRNRAPSSFMASFPGTPGAAG